METISAVCITPRRLCIPPRRRSPRCASLRGDNLRGVHPTTETISAVCITLRSQLFQISQESRAQHLKNSAVCITPRRQSLRCASLRGDNLSSEHPTAKSISMVYIPLRSQSPCMMFIKLQRQTEHRRVEIEFFACL